MNQTLRSNTDFPWGLFSSSCVTIWPHLPLPTSAASTSRPFWHMPMLSSLQTFAHAVHPARNAFSPSLIPTITNLIAFTVQLKCHLLQEASSPRSSVP